MAENQSPWLSTKHPPKQRPNAKRHYVAKGPLSRKLLPLQMTSGHGNFLSRLTQNSPPPAQLKLARKQSTLKDYFGSSTSSGGSKNNCKHLKPQTPTKRRLDLGEVKESDETVKFKSQAFPHTHHHHSPESRQRSICEKSLPAQMASNNEPIDDKTSPVKSQCTVSPLRERQLSSVINPASESVEEDLDNQNQNCTAQSGSLSFKTINNLNNSSTRLCSKEAQHQELNVSQRSSEFQFQRTKDNYEKIENSNKTHSGRDSFSLETLSQNPFGFYESNASAFIHPSFTNDLFDNHNISNRTTETQFCDFTLEKGSCYELEAKDSFKYGIRSERKRKRDNSITKTVNEDDPDPDMLVADYNATEEGIIDTGSLGFCNFLTCQHENTIPLNPENAETIDLNLSTDSQTLSFTADSQSLQFLEDSDSRDSDGDSVPTGSTVDGVYEDKANYLRHLKTKHMAQMGSLTLTQTEKFSK